LPTLPGLIEGVFPCYVFLATNNQSQITIYKIIWTPQGDLVWVSKINCTPQSRQVGGMIPHPVAFGVVGMGVCRDTL
jgi:hypothetical protein